MEHVAGRHIFFGGWFGGGMFVDEVGEKGRGEIRLASDDDLFF